MDDILGLNRRGRPTTGALAAAGGLANMVALATSYQVWALSTGVKARIKKIAWYVNGPAMGQFRLAMIQSQPFLFNACQT